MWKTRKNIVVLYKKWKKIIENIEKSSHFMISKVDVGNTEFDELTSTYSCSLCVEKLHYDFENSKACMIKGDECDFIGFDKVMYYVKCKCSETYFGNIEINEKSIIWLCVLTFENFNENDDIKIHIDYS